MRGSHDASDNLRTAGLSCSMGPYFDSLPPDALAAILGLVSGQDVAALSCTCRGLRAAGEDGEVWRVLLQRAFPASRLSASRLADWKHAFLLEANDIVGDLHCCHTKASYQEAVLGLPVRFTVNPRTGVVDYIEADMDLLSLEAVQAGVTKTTANDAFDALLPLYIDADHFQRALPAYPALLRKLAPEQVGRGGKAPPPQAWLEVLPKMMNTTLVLLCDKGLGLSERALHTYCSLHRLLLALIEHYDLFEAAHQRLDAFLSRPANRVKSACPSLGVLVPLLSVSSKHTWPTAARAIVGESFDRHILWMCQKNPGLAETLAKNPKAGGVDEELLTKGFEGASVSLRLLAFHVVFLRQVARPPGTTLDQVMDSYDALYGRPGAALQRRFKASIRQILEMPNWGAFFATCGLPVVNKAEMTAWLRTSWANSLRKGYHKKDTDFSRVQARGVSKILLKGQQYSAPKNIKRIQVTAHWNYSRATGGYIKWLDTSCLLFNPGQRFTEAVDWEHTISAATQHRGAITHSGMMDNQDDCSGSQIFDIDLSRLGPQIHEMFIAGSAWTDMLIDIRQPFLSIVDPDTKMALCEYHLEDQSRADLRHHKSVILCRVARGAAPGQWQVTAVGMLSQGMALRGRYQPMVDSIAAWTAAQRC
ncbi:hypothetical protein WJX72_001162 [[Myrmecia] bisecta]|uniref:F-box domain-containing protein n=1 Tax=[Myrmecia] bisecta TaxID=41462 RepID=A0AAW1R518_9CHLO